MNRYEFSAPGQYRIVVQGKLRPDWPDRLGAMQIVAGAPEAQADSEVTVLRGRVSDQAELSGILSTLYELHLPLLSVAYLGEGTASKEAE